MNDISYLPEEFEFSHWYCFFLHDQLVETLSSAESANLFNSIIKFKDPSHKTATEGLSGEEFIKWLEKNGYKSSVISLYYKQLCAALLSDFLHFIHESLQCSRKGKLTVAYALLRKPLKENLFYMEWLLARPGDFLKRFEGKQTGRFKLPYAEVSTEPEHIAIIREAMNNTKTGLWIDAEFIHELRFKKKSPISLEPLWQKATHLVTTFKHLQTEECNLNFVFSNPDDHYSQWFEYYKTVPILLFHAVEIIEALLKRFAKRKNESLNIMPLRNIAGMILHFEESPLKIDTNEIATQFKKIFEEAEIPCPKCENFFHLHHDNISSLYQRGSLSCKYGCGEICLHDLSHINSTR